MDVARNYYYWPKTAVRATFFFTQIPDNFHAKHMLAAFQNYGEFEEVVIPAKRDKLGKRIGFARAVNVADPKLFAIKLDNIIIGRNKIMVNLAKFNRNAGGVKVVREPNSRSSDRDAVSTKKVMEYRIKDKNLKPDVARSGQAGGGNKANGHSTVEGPNAPRSFKQVLLNDIPSSSGDAHIALNPPVANPSFTVPSSSTIL